MTWQLSSSVFADGRPIPSIYTCEGRDVSPPLHWSDPLAGTKSFALISDDPDAPGKTWVHWVLYNLPDNVRTLPEAMAPDAQLPDGARQGRTDFGRTGYGGPRPPRRPPPHFFQLYALGRGVVL